MDDVIEAVSHVGERHHCFEICFSEAGAFSSWNRPSVLWLGLHPKEGLKKIAEDIDRSLHENIGLELEKRDFRAHLTVARYRSRRPFDARAAKIMMEDSLRDLKKKGYIIRVKEFNLISSKLTPKGPIYTKISSFGLNKDGPG
jgi:2'-5' RNA ligase